MTEDKATMLVLGGRGVLGTMIAAAAEAAGWTAIRTSRQTDAGFRHVDLAVPETLEKVIDEADVVVSTVPESSWSPSGWCSTGAACSSTSRRWRPAPPSGCAANRAHPAAPC
jgi:hypothetical protein